MTNGLVDRESVRLRRLLAGLSAGGLLLAALLAWDSRYSGDPDSISYVDMAQNVVRGNFGALVNLYWSPLYPALNALLFAIFHPRPENVLPLMHFTGVLMFAAATAGFVFFITRWLRVTAPPVGEAPADRARLLVFWSWCIFLWVALRLISLTAAQPDMLTFAALLFAAGICLQIFESGGRPLQYVLLGLTLGIAYLSKFAAAPITAALLGLMFLFAKDRARTLKHLAITAAVFCVIAAPEIAAVSRRVGRFSFGDAGRLNIIWHVKLTPFLWTGPGGFQAGESRARVLNAQPLVIDYADPDGGTFPVWYDMERWQGDAPTHASVKQWLVSFYHRAQEMFRIFEDILPLLLWLIVLIAAAERKRARPLERIVVLFGLWGFAICAAFMPVHVEFRYIAMGVFLVCLVLYRMAERVFDWTAFRITAQLVGLMMFIPVHIPFGRAVGHAAQALAGRAEPGEHVIMAEQLRDLGVRPGDRIAVAGYAHEDYYAQIAGIQISTQVCDADSYADVDWHDPQASCRAGSLFQRGSDFLAPAIEALRRNGVKALVTREAPLDAIAPGWRRLGERYAVLIL